MAKSDDEDRKKRILDAAADLFVHFGFDKTTVSDIAREAGISKGAIYLHFASKDELLESLIIREMMAYGTKWFELIEADPEGGTIGGMYKNSLYALEGSAFMAAMYRKDGRVLGNYLRKPDNFFRESQATQNQSARYEFVKLMQAAGSVRQDLDPKVIAHIMDMLAYGLVGMDEVFPKDEAPPIEDVIEGIAKIMDTALTPDGGADSDTGKAILRQIANDEIARLEAARSSTQE